MRADLFHQIDSKYNFLHISVKKWRTSCQRRIAFVRAFVCVYVEHVDCENNRGEFELRLGARCGANICAYILYSSLVRVLERDRKRT